MKINNIPKVIYLFLFAIFLFSHCAKIVAPTGGPKDEDHPLIVKIEPVDYTVNFDSEKISITFDEFIQLKDLNNNLVISPPVDEKPDIRVKGKTLIIEFLEELKDSTTYNIYFGNSVQDYNEGNPIENFQYVLSTGSYIDSLSIAGQVINSYNLLPEEGVYVMLYKEFEDSIPIKQIPVYISKTDAEGFFRINNISHNRYKLFCLRDFNKNYLFDLPNEDIAFIDSLVSFDLTTELKVDTLYKQDSLNNLSESKIPKNQEIDTIIARTVTYFPVQEYVLRLFTEYHELQYLANNSRETKQKVDVVFNKPIKDSVIFTIVDTGIEKDWYIKEVGQNRDSITYWITDSTVYKKEAIEFALKYQSEDTNMIYQWTSDTLNLRYFEEKKKKRNEPIDTSLKYTLNVKNRGTIDLNSKLNFNFETPVLKYDTSKINLFAVIDTIEIPVEFKILKDSIKLRKYHMLVDWAEDTVYRLEIYPRAFTDIYETVNDTNIIVFQTQKRDFYGKVLANITGIDSSFQLICQLIIPSKDKETLFRQTIISKDQIIEYAFLPPKEFMFKVIIDSNLNGKWDSGEYLKHLQPEEVLYYDKKIKVRSNWDVEINFNVNK
ncbi:Ig-like domain-containing protein [Bacteroidota bacterium]